MVWPPSETLAQIAPYLPEQVISPTVLNNVQQLAQRLPDGLFSYYLECRLDDSPQVDFLAAALADKGREQLVDSSPGNEAAGALLEAASWRPIRCFLDQWAEPTTLLHHWAAMVWLEFDEMDRTLPATPLPGLCFCLDPDYVGNRSSTPQASRLNRLPYQELTDSALSLLYGQPVSPQMRRSLLACFERLPAGGRLIHISAMLARRPAVVKVYACVAQEDLLPYLTQIGWPGSPAELARVVAEFCQTLPILFVDLTIEDEIAPRIGLACSQVHLYDRPQADRGWKLLLDQCVTKGLCTPEKQAGLLDWPGSTREMFFGHAWPVQLSRWLDLKFVYQPQQPLEVKGYLGFMPLFSIF